MTTRRLTVAAAAGVMTVGTFAGSGKGDAGGKVFWNATVKHDKLGSKPTYVNGGRFELALRPFAVAMADGPDAGLALMDPLANELDRYHLFHAARADLLRRSGRTVEAEAAYRKALALVTNPVERRYLMRRVLEA